MKKNSKPTHKKLSMKLRKSRKELQSANESVALFLGPKLLGELRILMRLASPAAGRDAYGPMKEAPIKSY